MNEEIDSLACAHGVFVRSSCAECEDEYDEASLPPQGPEEETAEEAYLRGQMEMADRAHNYDGPPLSLKPHSYKVATPEPPLREEGRSGKQELPPLPDFTKEEGVIIADLVTPKRKCRIREAQLLAALVENESLKATNERHAQHIMDISVALQVPVGMNAAEYGRIIRATNEKLLGVARDLAAMKSHEDDSDFVPADSSGGNYDDCYSMGCKDGEIHLSRRLLLLSGEEKG